MSEIKINRRTVERDIDVVLPSGETIVLQYRAYDPELGPTVDILLPSPMPVNNFIGAGMSPAPRWRRTTGHHVRRADQLTLVFPAGDAE